jgi:hypothetical protein
MQIETYKEANANPDVENKVDTATDAGPQRQIGRIVREPGEIKARNGSEYGKQSHDRRSPILVSGIDQDAK